MNPNNLNHSTDFQNLFESAPSLLLVLSPTFVIEAVTHAYLEATKTNRNEIIGKGIFEVFPDNPNDPDATGVSNLKASLNRVLESKSADAMAPQKYDIPLPESLGGGFERKIWSPFNSPVFNTSGDLVYIIHRVEDITEFIELKDKGVELQTRTEQMESEIYQRAHQLQDANKKLREAEKLKNEFFANVSHELRTPLSLILAPLESHLAGKYGTLNHEQSNSLKIIHNNAARLLQMVNGLLDFAKFEAGKMTVEREPVDITNLIASILNDFESMIGSKSLLLIREVELPQKHVMMDRYLFERILFNLLSNAIKYTPEGGKILVKAKINGDLLEISVEDNGVGIAKEDLETIFEKFRQVEGSSTRRFEGTGLGLAMVKEFSELLGGRISVNSTLGVGSTFKVGLLAPLTEAKESGVISSRRSTILPRYKNVHGHSKLVSNGNNHQKVLVCEDNDELAEYIVSLLIPICQVKRAKEGEEAWELVNTWHPDLVLTDVMMPKKDGIELCREIKSNHETSKTTVVLLTALTHREAMIKGWESRADEYLFKPFHPDELVTRIRSLLVMSAERKTASDEIEKYTNQLEQSNKEMESFSYSISHDLRAPLRAIGGYSEILLEEYDSKLDEEGRRLIKNVISNTVKMAHQIDDLLKFVRVGNESLHKTRIAVTDLVTKLIQELESEITQPAEIIVYPMPEIHADHGLITHLYNNLITNAIKYSSKRAHPKIEIGFTPMEKGGAFFVKDNGVGFDMAYNKKLFGIFQRLHDQDEFEGTGIGLAIVERIVAKHDGKVWAEGKVNEGATFYFSIP